MISVSCKSLCARAGGRQVAYVCESQRPKYFFIRPLVKSWIAGETSKICLRICSASSARSNCASSPLTLFTSALNFAPSQAVFLSRDPDLRQPLRSPMGSRSTRGRPSYPYFRGRATRTKKGREIGTTIRKLREEKRITQEKLARAAGMIRANLSRIEASKHRPTLETIERIATALRVPVADLIAPR